MKKLILIFFLILTAIKFSFGQQPKLVLPIGHFLEINAAAFSPDGKQIVTASGDNTAKIWDVVSGKFMVELKGHEEAVSDASFSPDGKKIVTASWDRTAKIWDAKTGRTLAIMNRHTKAIHHASFSPDGKKIITAAEDTTVKVWDAASGKLLIELEGYVEGVFSAAPATFNPDGRNIITVANDSTMKIWDAVSGSLLVEKPKEDEILFNSAHSVHSPDGKKTYTIVDKAVQVKDVATGRVIAEMKGHADIISEARFSSNGKYFFTTNFYTPAKTWDAGTGQLLADLNDKQDDSNEDGNSASFSPDETQDCNLCSR